MFFKNILEKISGKLGITTSPKTPISCPCYYAEEKCIGGSPYPLEDFQSIMTHFAQLNDHNINLLGERFSEKDPSGSRIVSPYKGTTSLSLKALYSKTSKRMYSMLSVVSKTNVSGYNMPIISPTKKATNGMII